MMIRSRLILFIVTLITVAIIAACGNPVSQADPAPMFELKDLDGNKIALNDLNGEKVYIKYWASWCSICLAGLDELDTLASLDNDFKVITIVSPNFKGEMSSKKFTTWFEKIATDDLTVLLDKDGIWSEKFKVLAYPTSYYISSSGELAKTIIGHNSNEIITSEMKLID